ncbi:kinesin heavy chain-like, partial [Musca vetustissima]|uniref:kinesin heavy chain-like n=1 Tax=Musca vetustissima TaxID=27455 RepID=UPI002AB71618
MSAERDMPAEDRLNDRKERSGSKIVVKFPNSAEKNCLSIGPIHVTNSVAVDLVADINQQSQYVKNLKEQIVEQEKLIANARREYEALQSEMARTQQENESAKEEKKAVILEMVELTLNSSQKKKHIKKMLSDLLRDLAEVGQTLSSADSTTDMKMNSIPSAGDIDKVEEDFTMARLYNLETQKIDSNKKLSEYERDLGEYRMIISQHKANMKSLLQQSMREAENKKRSLEEQIDSLREECAKLKAAEHVSAVNAEEKQKAEELRAMFDSQMDELREAHTKQVSELRDEIIAKQHEMAEMKDLHQKLILAHQQMAADYEKLKQEEAEKSNKLQEIILTNERREQARNDLKGLEDTVAKKLQTLHNLRKLFVQNLQARIKKTVLNEDSEEDGGSLAQKQKISFLENNLDQLTKVHKQLVRDNADLRCELPKLEKRLRTTMERVKALETALKEAKEGAMRDRKRYQYEVDRIKEAVRQKHFGRRGPQAKITKPISAGQGANTS